MKTLHTERPLETPLTQDVTYAVRYWLHALRQRIGGRRGLIAATVLVIGLGLAFNWSWVVAAGFAPFLIAVLPCAAMCGLGLCMKKGAEGSCSETKDPDVASTWHVAPPVRIAADADPLVNGSVESRSSNDPTMANDGPAIASGLPKSPKERK